jgi:hypothetical protein
VINQVTQDLCDYEAYCRFGASQGSSYQESYILECNSYKILGVSE